MSLLLQKLQPSKRIIYYLQSRQQFESKVIYYSCLKLKPISTNGFYTMKYCKKFICAKKEFIKSKFLFFKIYTTD